MEVKVRYIHSFKVPIKRDTWLIYKMDYTGKNNSIPKVKSPFTTVEIKIIHDDGLVFLDILDHKKSRSYQKNL